ncbi:MAG: hypothetical protein ACKVP5_23525 [Aestuariivirga sp.]
MLTTRTTAPQTGGKTVTVSNCVLARQAMQAIARQTGGCLELRVGTAGDGAAKR